MSTAHFSADQCYEAHVAFCRGVSQVSGAKLPDKLVSCPPGVQASWYGQACFHTFFLQAKDLHAKPEDVLVVPVPRDVAADVATEQRRLAHAQYWHTYGFYG